MTTGHYDNGTTVMLSPNFEFHARKDSGGKPVRLVDIGAVRHGCLTEPQCYRL